MRVLDYLFFCRPMLLIPVWTVHLLFRERFQRASEFSQDDLLTALSFTALFSAAYVINQIFDRESDRLNKKLGFLEEPISIGSGSARALFLALSVAPLMYALLLQPSLIFCFATLIVLGVLYSAPPVRAKDRPFPGWLFNAVTYSALLWWGALALSGAAPEDYFNSAPEALAMFLAISATYALTTIPDAAGDVATGKRTMAIALGTHWTLMLAGLFSAASLTLSAVVGFWPLAWSAALALILVFLAIMRREDRFVLLAAKAPILALSVGAVVAFPLYGLFLVALILLTRVYYRRRWNMNYPSLR